MNVTSNFSGVVHTVGDDKDFVSIQDAINAASIGDVLLIDPGNYADKNNLSTDKQVHLYGNTDDIENNPIIVSIEGFVFNGNKSIGDKRYFLENLTISLNYSGYQHFIRGKNGGKGVFNKCNLDQIQFYNYHDYPQGDYDLYFHNCYLDNYSNNGFFYQYDGDGIFPSYIEVLDCYSPGISWGITPDVIKIAYTPTVNYGLHYGTNYYSEFYIDGYVVVQGRPVERTVRLYRRSNGRLISETVSDRNNNGYFWFALPNKTDYFYFTVLDDIRYFSGYHAKTVDYLVAREMDVA